MKTSNKKTLSFYSLSLLASLVLAGCATGPVPTEPEPKITEDVHAVMALPDVGSATTGPTTLAGLFKAYTGCQDSTKVWEEMESGVIFFSCREPRAGILQFIWEKTPEGKFVFKKCVATMMADQEWNAMEFRGDDGLAMLERVRRNERIIEEAEASPLPARKGRSAQP